MEYLSRRNSWVTQLIYPKTISGLQTREELIYLVRRRSSCEADWSAEWASISMEENFFFSEWRISNWPFIKSMQNSLTNSDRKASSLVKPRMVPIRSIIWVNTISYIPIVRAFLRKSFVKKLKYRKHTKYKIYICMQKEVTHGLS